MIVLKIAFLVAVNSLNAARLIMKDSASVSFDISFAS